LTARIFAAALNNNSVVRPTFMAWNHTFTAVEYTAALLLGMISVNPDCLKQTHV